MLLKPAGFLRANTGGGGGSAMASDASAIRSHVPSTVQHTSGVITAWNDQSGNAYHLAQVASVPLPSYDTVNDRVQFDGTELIGDASFAYANSERAVLDGGGSITRFMVALHTQLPDTFFDTRVLAADGSTDGGNLVDYIGYNQNGGESAAGKIEAYHRGFDDAYYANAPDPSDAAAIGVLLAIRVEIDQSNAVLTVTDGTTTWTDTVTVTPANFATFGDGFFIGGHYSTTPALENAMIGDVVLYHSTTAADTSAIWTEVQTFL